MTDDSQRITVDLHEEYLTARKKQGVTSVARVHKKVETESADMPFDVAREHAEIERVPVDHQVVTSAPQPYWDDDVYVVPVVEEELVVTKRLVVREEVRIRRVAGTETVSVPVTLRRERVEVTEIGVDQETGNA